MISKWPEFEEKYVYTQDEADMAYVIDAIRQIRNIRHEMNVPMSKKAQLIAVTADASKANVLQAAEPLLKALAACSALTVQEDKNGISDDAASVALENAQLYIPLEELIDIQKEIERLAKEKENLEKELKRVSGKLSNEGFMAKAPANVIAEERAKLDKYTSMYESVEERLRVMKERCV
jgi:valyl-tRNA synthetase